MDLQEFTNENLGVSVRVVDRDGEPWFVAKDVCDALDIQNTTQALSELDDDERAMFNIGRQGDANIISEPGLYSFVIRSRKPQAKAFKRWITHEVLPSIRKHGAYATPKKLDEIAANPETAYTLAEALIKERDRTQLLEAKESIFGNRTPYGLPSKHTGNPRVIPVHGYLRSTSTGIEFVPDAIQLQLFEPEC